MGLLAQIVGHFQYLSNCISINFDENELCPGVVSILVNTELRTWAHFTLRNCSWFWENEKGDVDVKADLKVACCSLDSRICVALFLNSSALSEGFVLACRMLWVFSTGYSSKIVM